MLFRISPTTETNLKSLVAFAAMLTLTGFIGSYVAGGLGVYLSLGFTSTFTFATLWYCRELSLWLMNAKEVKTDDKPEGFDLNKMVEDLCSNPNINLKTKPKVCVIKSDKKNAFATGRSKSHTAIAITTGLLKEAKEKAGGDMIKASRWIEAIWCHELGHIVNHDVATKGVISILSSALRILSESIYDQKRAREKDNKDNNKNKDDKDNQKNASFLQIAAEYLLFYWIIPFTGTLLSLCLSRAREFAADDMAKKCGRAEDLAQAFENLLTTSEFKGGKHSHTHHTCPHMEALSSMMCLSLEPEEDQKRADSLADKNIGWFKWSCLQFAQLTSTHPAMEDRIKRLRSNDDATANTTEKPATTTRAVA